MNIERLRIEKLVPGGLGLARVAGRVVLTPGVLPNELVEVRITGKSQAYGELLRLIEPSPDRVDVPEHAPPTMDFAFLGHEAQLRHKRDFVIECLERIAKMRLDQLGCAVLPTQASPLKWAYRNGAQYLVTRQGLAYRERGSQHPVLVRSDPLTSELITAGIAELEPRLLEPSSEVAFRASFETGEVVATLIGLGKSRLYYAAREHLRELGVIGVDFAFASTEGRFREGGEHLWGATGVLERYGNHTQTVNASGFAQVNPLATGRLYQHTAALAGGGRRALDLFGGSGGLGLHLRERFDQVTVLEISSEATQRGRLDAQRLGIELHFERGDARRLGLLARQQSFDLITLDPPRAGLSKETLEQLLMSKTPKLLYISCDPSTWARDVAKLIKGGYALTHLQPWDFYPQTHHVELLSLLER